MKDRKRYLAAHYQVGFRARIKFQLLDEIDKQHSSQPCVWKEHEEIVNELVAGISVGSMNRYNLDGEYVCEKYGICDEATAMLLCEIAFYQAGCDASKTHSSPTMDYLSKIEENMEDAFLDGYQLEHDVLTKLVNNLKGKALDVADESRDINRHTGAVKKFCKEIDEERDEDAIISKMNLYNDGSYLEIAPSICSLAGLLRYKAYWEEYYLLLEILKYFPLQGCLIKSLDNMEDIATVIQTVERHKGRKSVQYLLREQCFSTLCKEGNILTKNLKDQFLSDEDKAYIKVVYDGFVTKRSEHVNNVVCIWLNVFGKEELTDWLSRKKKEAEQKQERYGQPELEVVNKISEGYSITSSEIAGFNFDDKSFYELITLAKIADNKDVCEKVFNAIQKCIFSERCYPPTSLNKTWFEQVRTIYHCMSISGIDGFALLRNERRSFEGFRVDIGVSMHNIRQEAYWMAMLLLSLEESGDGKIFDQLCDVLFRDTVFAMESLSDDVFSPFYVAELLVSQVITEKKDSFEKRIIADIPYLVFVIRVLTGNDGEMSTEIKQLLKDRIMAEWVTERKLLSQRKVANIGFYDEYVKTIMNVT